METYYVFVKENTTIGYRVGGIYAINNYSYYYD